MACRNRTVRPGGCRRLETAPNRHRSTNCDSDRRRQRARGALLRGTALVVPRPARRGRRGSEGADRGGRGGGRSRLPVARQSARARLSLLRHQQGRRRAGADQHPLSHPRHGVHRGAVGCDDAHRRRPRPRRRLPGDAPRARRAAVAAHHSARRYTACRHSRLAGAAARRRRRQR